MCPGSAADSQPPATPRPSPPFRCAAPRAELSRRQLRSDGGRKQLRRRAATGKPGSGWASRSGDVAKLVTRAAGPLDEFQPVQRAGVVGPITAAGVRSGRQPAAATRMVCPARCSTGWCCAPTPRPRPALRPVPSAPGCGGGHDATGNLGSAVQGQAQSSAILPQDHELGATGSRTSAAAPGTSWTRARARQAPEPAGGTDQASSTLASAWAERSSERANCRVDLRAEQAPSTRRMPAPVRPETCRTLTVEKRREQLETGRADCSSPRRVTLVPASVCSR